MSRTISVKCDNHVFLVEIDDNVKISSDNGLQSDFNENFSAGIPPGTAPISNVTRIERQFPEVESLIVACCNGLHKSIAKIPAPDKLTVEFGVKFGGEAGVPVITKVIGECNFKVVIEWKRSVEE